MLPPFEVEGPAGAPVLVLAGSLGSTTAMWDPQVGVLAQRFRVVRYDHRGHGGSPAPPGPYAVADLGGDLIELLDHLGVERASICGLSLGGVVAQWVAAHHPERVEGLILACTAAHLPPADAWRERAATVRASAPRVLLDTLLGRWFTPTFVTAHPEVRDRLAAMLDAADPEGYAGCCEALAGADLRPDLAAVTASTLVIAGAADAVTPPSAALELQGGIAGAALVVLADAAHLANLEQHERFTTAVVDHLAGTVAERGRRTRTEVLGTAHVARSEGGADAFDAPFVDLITRYAWGEIWTRPGLDRATRSCITLAILTALGRHDELALHVRAARRNGLDAATIGEVLLQAAIYAGVPAANSAFAVARRVLAEAPEEDQTDTSCGKRDAAAGSTGP